MIGTIPNSILLKDTILMTGFPNELTPDELKLKLPDRYQKAVDKVGRFRLLFSINYFLCCTICFMVVMKCVLFQIDLFSEKGIAILLVSNKEEFDYILLVFA